jgi:hypothetical protein
MYLITHLSQQNGTGSPVLTLSSLRSYQKFGSFDVTQRGYISISELKDGLKLLPALCKDHDKYKTSTSSNDAVSMHVDI